MLTLTEDAKIKKEKQQEPLTPAEALYGFCAWLTSRKTPTIMCSTCDASPVVELMGQFCKLNNLEDPGDDFKFKLVHVKESE